MQYIIRKTEGYYPSFYEVRVSASVIGHFLKDIEVTKDESSKFACDKCCKSFTKVGNLTKHERAVHYCEKHECVQCGLKFSRSDNLQHHIKVIHTDYCGHECELCKQSFSKKSHLIRHRKVYHACEICSAKCCTTKQLQLHMKVNHPKFLCEYCQKSFPDNANLKRHQAGSFDKKGIWKNFCELCDIGFCSFLDLSKHNKRHPKECKFCSKTFATNWKLKVHMLKRDEKLCEKCGIVVCNTTELNIHIKRIHNVKQCKLCQKSYSNENFKHHMYAEHQQIIDE